MSLPNAIMDVVRDMFRKELKKHDDAKAAHKRAFLEHTLLTKRTALALGHTGNPRDGKSMKATEELASIVEPGGKKGEMGQRAQEGQRKHSNRNTLQTVPGGVPAKGHDRVRPDARRGTDSKMG